ncbi:leucyl aminopeptidase family protein [Paracoccus aminophilus]|uniref:Leucyl aminopeptidase n=1 Tax=Paracoccus aminophilus JCM 7686 TaxID=1367847 RepID=S5Y3H0_PARAH|nr:leucyl aminopeptidase family protein [Paracoccus aminophilus]AGT10300.1 leucyl aminopeptidase [Paracoccus aminophilus JCM 7686]
MTAEFAPSSAPSLPLWLIRSGETGPVFPEQIGPEARAWAKASGFAARPGQICLLPGADGALLGALYGLGAAPQPGARPARERYPLARAADALPGGNWRLENVPDDLDLTTAALSWLLANYRFDRYKKAEPARAHLVAPAGVDEARVLAMAAGEYLARDLINTPTSDLGPDELEAAARDLTARHGGEITVIAGDELLAQNFPMIHAVGRASAFAPRLIDIRFPGEGPKVTLVGKGVCFDTGGLDIKPPSSMLLMKKDMGGAASVMGLTEMLARLGVTRQISLRVLLPVVENSISANAFRPGDVLTSRKGLTVEVNNTDAEGRLILADALALAEEEAPDFLVSMATLTGAARVALGPDLPPFYCDDDRIAGAIQSAGMRAADPIWRMPFWEPYESQIEPQIADLDNAPSGGFAGSITAALFLRRFTTGAKTYAHFDIYGWQPSAAPGRPKGGTGQAMRALLDALPEILK